VKHLTNEPLALEDRSGLPATRGSAAPGRGLPAEFVIASKPARFIELFGLQQRSRVAVRSVLPRVDAAGCERRWSAGVFRHAHTRPRAPRDCRGTIQTFFLGGPIGFDPRLERERLGRSSVRSQRCQGKDHAADRAYACRSSSQPPPAPHAHGTMNCQSDLDVGG